MSGRHRKPTKTGLRLAQAGALSIMAAAPLSLVGSAMAATPTALDRHQAKADSDHSSDDDADDNDRYARDDSDGDRDDDSDAESADYRDGDDSDEPERWSYATHGHANERQAAQRQAAAAERKAEAAEEFVHPTSRSATSSTRSATARGRSVASTANKTAWDRLAHCESTQNWAANTGNGFKGGLQFTDSTWRSFGGGQYARSADKASREEQIAVAKKVQAAQGWSAWPSCSRKLGYS
jgi:transglycosylase-like protein